MGKAGSGQADDDKMWEQKDLDDGVSVVTFERFERRLPTPFHGGILDSITRVFSEEG